MATVDSVLTYARQLCQTDSNGISDTLGIALSNDAANDFIRELINRDIDAAQTAEAYTNITTDNPNTYAWPSDMYALKTVEVDFSGTGGQNYLQAKALEVANIQNVSFDYLRVNQPTSLPLIDNRGDTFELFPVAQVAVTAGIRIFYFKQFTEFTLTSDAIAYPFSLDYRCLSAKVAYLYNLTLEKGGKVTQGTSTDFESDYQSRLQKIIRILAPGTQQPITPQPLAISGWQY